MGLKQIIARKNLYNSAIEYTMTIPFEPLLFSVKHQLLGRRHDLAFFRNKQWYSILKCRFPSYTRKKIPVVVIVKFYVPPPHKCYVTKEEVRKEKTPALESPELTEYLLSFLEMIMWCLIGDYRQVVKIDMCKFYSNKPRTTFQFMKWSNYELLLTEAKNHTQAENERANRPEPSVQSERLRDGTVAKRNKKTSKGALTLEGPAPGCAAFPLAGRAILEHRKKKTAKLLSTLDQTRRRQSRKVSQRLLQKHSMGGRFTDFVDAPLEDLDET